MHNVHIVPPLLVLVSRIRLVFDTIAAALRSCVVVYIYICSTCTYLNAQSSTPSIQWLHFKVNADTVAMLGTAVLQLHLQVCAGFNWH